MASLSQNSNRAGPIREKKPKPAPVNIPNPPPSSSPPLLANLSIISSTSSESESESTASPEMEHASSPRAHGVVVIAVAPEHHVDCGKMGWRLAAAACGDEAGGGVEEEEEGEVRWRERRVASLWSVAGALLVVAALAVAGHYCLYHDPAAFSREEGRSSFLLPLYPKSGGGGAGAGAAGESAGGVKPDSAGAETRENSSAVLPIRGNVFPDGCVQPVQELDSISYETAEF